MKPIEFNGPERSASAFFYFASRSVPVKVKKVHHFEDIEKWVKEVNEDILRRRSGLLLTTGHPGHRKTTRTSLE